MGIAHVRDNIGIHDRRDAVLTGWHGAEPAEVDKYLVIQEREVGYRLTLHQHPYVGRLMQRLLSRDTSALLAADTEFAPGNAARPDSVVFAIGGDVVLTVPAGARAALTADVTVTTSGGPLPLAEGTGFKIGPAPATLARAHARPPAAPRLEATLLGEPGDLPPAGSSFTLPAGSTAVVRGNTPIKLEAPAPIILTGGTAATLPAGTEVALADGASVVVPDAASGTLLRVRRLPAFFAAVLTPYKPTSSVEQPHPVKDLDFTYGGAYSIYNWELFFHVPLTMAVHLSKNGRFAEAQRWFHYVFDPTDNSDGPTPERFWKVLPFHTADARKVEDVLVNLVTGSDAELRAETIRGINAWQNAPFRPHVIARNRPAAYMVKTVTAYLDNLIAWGDSLFRQDTGEAVDEALMLYVLAANILGPRPQAVPAKGSVRPQTYHNLRQGLKHFGTVVRDLEADVPFDLAPLPAERGSDSSSLATVRSLGRALYFCVPRNDRLLGYWDTVADRLFKIRNSLNIQGVFRRLALFEPPIDPALLVRAAAAGLDVGAVVSGVDQPLPLVRFQLLAQKAAEIAQEVKSLGGQLLSAMEKEDGEALAVLRARHERAVMEMAERVKYGQLQEAIKGKEGLLQSLALAAQRYAYYERQLGKTADEIEIPELDELDEAGLAKLRLSATEPALELPEIQVDLVQDLVAEGGGKKLIREEADEIAKLVEARASLETAAAHDLWGSAVAILPDPTFNLQPFGTGSSLGALGGAKLAASASALSGLDKREAEQSTYEAGNAARIGGYSRREMEWALQRNLAAGEINQIFKQLRAAQIRVAVAEQELKSHRQQMKHADEIERFLNEEGVQPTGKKTNRSFYAFQKREVRGLYEQCFRLAFDVAKKAERALQHELGDRSLSYLQFGHLAGKEGLLAGEKLYLDVKRMEMAYHDLNRREYELTKHVSLLQADPLALVRLRATGRCTVRLSEELFDMDGPGHYFRRIKSVAVSIPCVTGPFAGVNCTLTLLKGSIRRTPVVDAGYARADAEDGRFDDYFGSLQSVVTSTGQNDSGLFETNLHDERYLPFENSGVISEWRLELPADPSKNDPRQFDYQTISDVILHLRYTARQGGSSLRKAALENLRTVEDGRAIGAVRLFSIRHEFPTAWARFKSARLDAGAPVAALTLDLRDEHYPFWSRGRLAAVRRADLIAKTRKSAVSVSNQPDLADSDTLGNGDASLGDLRAGKLVKTRFPAPTGEFKLHLDDNSMDDLWLMIAWGNGTE